MDRQQTTYSNKMKRRWKTKDFKPVELFEPDGIFYIKSNKHDEPVLMMKWSPDLDGFKDRHPETLDPLDTE